MSLRAPSGVTWRPWLLLFWLAMLSLIFELTRWLSDKVPPRDGNWFNW